jgi:hypothetical protein
MLGAPESAGFAEGSSEETARSLELTRFTADGLKTVAARGAVQAWRE